MSRKTLYNPATLHKDDLIKNFLIHTRIFEKIFEDIRSSTMKYAEKHYLIQGRRGMGKTTLLLRLKYEIENTPALSSSHIPVFINEEMYDITSLSRLWERLLLYLDDAWGTTHYEHTKTFENADNYENRCFEYLIMLLRKEKKKLILFFDNFGQLFLNNLKGKEKRRLREVLMNCADLRVIAATSVVLPELHDYSQPFYEFFHIVPLKGLSKDEAYEFITRLQETDGDKADLVRSKPKIEALSILTEGVIRPLMLVYQLLLKDEDSSAIDILEAVMDQYTPFFYHRMEDLPVQQRRIVDIVAKKWDAVNARDIAGNIRGDSKAAATKLISAQLQQLERIDIIEKKKTSTKNHLYQLKDRFFNSWYLMRNGDRRDKTKIKWLTEFLETWYSDEYKSSSLILAEKGKVYTPANNLVLRAAFDEMEASDYASAQTKLTKYLDRAEKYKYATGEKRLLNEILLLMLSRNQYHSAQDLFNRSENLREVLKPTYYALLTLLKEEYPNEIIKMGSELDQPVKDILKKVTEMQNPSF